MKYDRFAFSERELHKVQPATIELMMICNTRSRNNSQFHLLPLKAVEYEAELSDKSLTGEFLMILKSDLKVLET